MLGKKIAIKSKITVQMVKEAINKCECKGGFMLGKKIATKSKITVQMVKEAINKCE